MAAVLLEYGIICRCIRHVSFDVRWGGGRHSMVRVCTR